MPESDLSRAIATLRDLVSDDPEWQPLRDLGPELRERTAWMRDQLALVPAPLVAVLYGGTGAGKSTLLNAIAGAPIAVAGVMRPTTEEPTVYLPPTAARVFGDARYVTSGCLENLVLVDLPDTDSVKTEHRARVGELLKRADVVLFCGTQQKYKNEQSVALLRPLRNERKIVCVQTRADEDMDICADWLRWVEAEGFTVDHCFRVSGARAFRRKHEGVDGGDEFEFGQLEAYLREKLPPERTGIKLHNLRGAVQNTAGRVLERLQVRRADLMALDRVLGNIEERITSSTIMHLQARLLDEPHVWVVALGEAVSERAFGFTGLLYRVLHWLRMVPSRLSGAFSVAGLLSALSPSGGGDGGSIRGGGGVDMDAFLRDVTGRYGRELAEANAYLSRNGFAAVAVGDWQDGFMEELRRRMETYLGPVQQRVTRRARRLTRYLLPLLEVVWLGPFAFTIAIPLYNYYVNLFGHAQVVLPDADYLSRTAVVTGVVIFAEVAAFAWVVRVAGRHLRSKSRRELTKGFWMGGFGFAKQREAIRRALDRIEAVERLESSSD